MSLNQLSIAVVILNYNNWNDTISCVKSVLASSIQPSWVFVVDNASTDNSINKLLDFAHEKSLNYEKNPTEKPDNARLIFIESNQNNGYAAGNNLGIKLAIDWGADAVWILNNDTEVEPQALGAMQERLFSKDRPGLCGSQVRYKDSGLVQCCAGGTTNPWTGLSNLFAYKFSTNDVQNIPSDHVEKSINFIYGASVMASRDFIKTVGLMDERFFLYCEEQDWAYSSKGRFDFAYAPLAIVYHKEGSSTRFSSKSISLKALWHLSRSRLLVTYKHKPYALPTVILSIFFAGIRMFFRRMTKKFKNLVHG